MKKSPQEIQKFLDTHTPNRKERKAFEARYKKQQKKARRSKPKSEPVAIVKTSQVTKKDRFFILTGILFIVGFWSTVLLAIFLN